MSNLELPCFSHECFSKGPPVLSSETCRNVQVTVDGRIVSKNSSMDCMVPTESAADNFALLNTGVNQTNSGERVRGDFRMQNIVSARRCGHCT